MVGQVGINHVYAKQEDALWYPIPDVVASILATGNLVIRCLLHTRRSSHLRLREERRNLIIMLTICRQRSCAFK
jgi:hypothetical protein